MWLLQAATCLRNNYDFISKYVFVLKTLHLTTRLRSLIYFSHFYSFANLLNVLWMYVEHCSKNPRTFSRMFSMLYIFFHSDTILPDMWWPFEIWQVSVLSQYEQSRTFKRILRMQFLVLRGDTIGYFVVSWWHKTFWRFGWQVADSILQMHWHAFTRNSMHTRLETPTLNSFKYSSKNSLRESFVSVFEIAVIVL